MGAKKKICEYIARKFSEKKLDTFYTQYRVSSNDVFRNNALEAMMCASVCFVFPLSAEDQNFHPPI
jgi:hypothetical protein